MPEQIEDKLMPLSKLRVLRALGILCGLVLLLPFATLALPSMFGWSVSDNISWVLLIFGGFAFLIVTLFSASILFRVFELHDIKHSLALPRNSIRSLLTFLVFMILMAFIFYSSHIVSTKDAVGEMVIAKAGYAETIDALGLKGRILKFEEIAARNGEPAQVMIQFLVEKESVSLEYFDRILVALLGISSTIIGFYFGSRTREDPSKPEAPLPVENAPQAGLAVPLPEGADTDGQDWAIISESLKLTARDGGGFTGHVTISADALDELGEFGAQFEPTKSHSAPTDNADVTVTRLGDRLTLTVGGLTAEDIGEEAQMSIFYRDQEERAQAVPVELT